MGKTTTAFAVHALTEWPVVEIETLRSVADDEDVAWDWAQRVWRAWDAPELTPPHVGIWVSTGYNWREQVVWTLSPPRYVMRVWLTANPATLQARWRSRPARDDHRGPWPFDESPYEVAQNCLAYDRGERVLPWPVDAIFRTDQAPPPEIANQIVRQIRDLAPFAGH
ncbi:hypothetical protein [Sulfobacillus thermosulfidooxidans]|uniref:hypothetical protein n=1 Tax=Sulfobacillus thermosulfidooxidans TaxID=28034 RepID=UPI0006B63798|nr:hypothetical protein [Sulfobacillus thermosulfidooxidans]